MIRRILPNAVLLVSIFWVDLGAQEAQNETRPTNNQITDSPPELDPKIVQKELDDVEKNTSLDDTRKTALKGKFQLILDVLEKSKEFENRADGFEKSVENAPQQAEKNRQDLADLPTKEEAGQVGSRYSFDSIRDELDISKAKFEAKTKELTSQTAISVAVQARPVEIVARLPAARKEVNDARTAWEKTSGKSEESLTIDEKAERWLNQANWLRAANEVSMLEKEQLSQRQRVDELNSRVALLRREVENSNARVDALGKLLSQEISSDIERFRSVATQAMESMPNDLVVQSLGNELLAMADSLASVSANANTLADRRLQLKAKAIELENDYLSITQEVRLGSGGIELAQVLIELGRRLGGPPVKQDDLMSIEQARLTWFKAREQKRDQTELEKNFQNYPAIVTQLVESRGKAALRLEVESNDLTSDLGDFQLAMQNYSQLSAEIQEFVSQKLFGFEIRSSPLIGVKTLTEAASGFSWLFGVDHFSQFRSEFNLSDSVVWFGLVTFVLLLALRPFIVRRIQKLNHRTFRISTDHIRLTIKGLALTTLLAAPLPLIWFLVFWALTHFSTEHQWMVGLGFVTRQLFAFVIITSLFREVSHPDGIGVKHFKWKESDTARFGSKLFWILLVYLPLMVMTSSFVYGDGAKYFASAGRISFILAHLWILIVMKPFRSLRQMRAEAERSEEGDADGGYKRWLKFLALTIVCSILILVALACIGYMMTANYMSILLATSCAILLFSRLAYCFTLRWLEIRRRRLAFAAAIARRKAQRDGAEEEESKNVQEDLGIDEEEELKLDLDTAGNQSERVLRLVFNVATATTLYIYWSAVFPLTSLLEKTEVPLVSGLSLLQCAKAIVVLLVSVVLVKNLPGLIEFVFLSRSKTELGTRKAIHTLGQYGVCTLTIFVLANILNWDWSQLGWLAAALSVGLGFGLQEIVANFVCGIILLFERPIRIGDVVSLAGNTGVVTKINLRATVITDWDRQEIVVPNKNLITGTIFNWTLSAKLNRIVVPLGVTFGTDTSRAIQIMLEVAAQHPDVIEDPPPTAHFTGFGESSLDLVLRAFLADRDNRENAITSLHTEIKRRFEQEGIEIAYPQRQLHLNLGVDD